MKKFQTIKKLLLRNNENSYSNRNFNSNHKSCYDNVDKKPWCEECVPCCIIEGWTSGNNDVDAFVKDTIYNAGLQRESLEGYDYYPLFLEWVPFDRFKGIEQIGVGGFAKVYSATWIDGQAKYKRQEDGSWKKLVPDPIKFALKKLNGSQNMTVEYLNEVFL
ncbi:hypothetical protein RclHR1_02720009 [Rhizophagus clarus]|uniref:Kinase-like domain-containing protein n=1 Tax=Rhizophagus clarus TaxID=94130 RepID=A0A2Z6RE92_9GLOM|nr:hypothetical protein RclHR1_02720009 [Rhizophagus clarus]GES80776.1 kinase-like domain-containing protein [Rhizophagus clarus]